MNLKRIREDDEQLRECETTKRSLQQTPSCSSDSTVAIATTAEDSCLEDIRSEGVQSFCPSILKSWVRIYTSMSDSPCCQSEYAMREMYINNCHLPAGSDSLSLKVIKTFNTVLVMSLMDSQPECFNEYDIIKEKQEKLKKRNV